MRLRNLLKIGVVIVQLNFFCSAMHAQALLNVDFGAGTNSAKVGFAATGQSTNDYWNFYSRDDASGGYRTIGAVSNLKRADGTVSSVGLTVSNAPGAWQNGTADPMYNDYLYPLSGGNITVTVTNLPAGSYDLFLYGHGGPGVDTANSVFQVVSGSSDYGTKATTTTSAWTSPVWQEGQQYVVFRDVAVVSAGGSVTVTVFPGAYGQSFINGMQVVQKSPPPPPVAGPLLNVDFGAGTTSAKAGFAATGQSTNDYWNLYSRDDGSGGYRTIGAVSNLKRADGTVSAVGLTVTNAPGAWQNGTPDPMYNDYLYPLSGGNITVTVTNLPVGSYDLFLYGHGGPGVDTANSVFQVVSGSSDYGTKATTTTSGWSSPVWQEGRQYVVFRDVAVVSAGGSVTVTVFPGTYGQSFINGMQVVQKSPPPPPVAGPLLNVDFGAGTTSAKVGFAATGQSTNDYWDLYSRDDGSGGYRTVGAVSNLKRADGTVSSVGLTVSNAPGAWQNGTADPMYNDYLYPLSGGNITVTVTNLPVGSYDFFLYGHGGPGVDTANSVFQVVSGSSDYGTKATTTTSGWSSPVWQEGQQYVVFRDVSVVNAGGSVTVTVFPGTYGQAFISGMQAVQKSPPPPPVAGPLLNVDFGAGTNSAKVGFAATGQSTNDYWNLYSRDDGSGGYRTVGAVSNLKRADGTVSAVGLTVTNAPGAWQNGTPDPMYNDYLYPLSGGNITVTVTNLPVGSYDLFLYGHGGPGVDTANSVFQVVSGSSDYGTKATTTTSGWTSPVWQEGQQYVVFRDVAVVSAGGSVTVTVFPGTYGQAFISGMQAVQKSPTPPPTGCVAPFSGLVGWWKGDGGTTDAVGSNNGALVGNASFAPGIVGQAFSFDGDNDSVMIGNPAALQLQDISIEAWIKRASTNQASLDIFHSGTIFGYGYGGYSLAVLDDGRLALSKVGIVQVGSTRAITDTNWHHVAVTKAAASVTFYLDGLGEAAAQFDPGFYFTSSTQIGAIQWDGTQPRASFLGSIDEVSLYNRALSRTEVVSIYAAGSAGKCPPISEPSCVRPPSGLISWWKGEDGAADEVGANPGTVTGGLVLTNGIVGQAFHFNGIDSQVSFGNTVGNFDTNDFTIDFWIRTTGTGHQSLIEKWPTCAFSSEWYTRLRPSGQLEAEMMSDSQGNDRTILVSGRAINDGVFHHVAFLRRGTNLAYYLDGILDASSNSSAGVTRINNSAGLTVGRSVCVGGDGTSPFTGEMDEISIYNHALSDSEIRAVYHAGSAGKCPPPPLPIISAFTNGSFELPALASGSNQTLPAGSGSLTGWTVGNTGRVEVGNGPVLGVSPVDGSQHIGFNGGDASPGGSISQTFSTTVGQTYAVGLYVGRIGQGNGTMSLHAVVTASSGQILGSLDAAAPVSPGYGPPQTFMFTAATEASTLTFTDTSSATIGVDLLLDNISVTPVVACVSQPAGLVGWWKGDGGTTDAVGTNNGALVGNASFAPGVVGQAFSFDGDNDSVMIGNPAALQLQNFTIEAWIKRSNTNLASLDIFQGGSIFGYGYGGYVFVLSDDGRLTLGQVGISAVNSTMSIRDTDWHHVAVSKTSGAVAFYVDGVGEAAPQYNPSFYFISSVQVGASQWDGTRPTASFLGRIDEVSVYNRALSGAEVVSIYAAGSAGKCAPVTELHCVQPPSGLLGWWKGEGNGNDATGANNATLMNGISFSDGKVGQAFDFNGIDSQVRFGNTVGNFGTNDFTIDFWIRTTATRLESVIEKWPVCGHASMFTVRIGGPGVGAGKLNAVLEQDDVGSNQNSLISARQVNDGVFHHVALVRKGTSATFYIDGILDSTASSPGITRISNSVDLVAGRSVCVGIDGTANFTGQLDEISIYNRSLSDSEIQSLYHAGSAGKCALPLLPARALAHWKFDETAGTTARDSAGLYNGTLSATGASFVPGGVSGGALNLVMTNSGFVTMGNVLGLESTDYSIIAWIKMAAGDTTDNYTVLSKHAAYTRNGFIVHVNKAGGLLLDNRASFIEGGSGVAQITPAETPISTTSVNDGNWHQIVAVFQMGGMKSIYVDGAPAEDSKLSQPFNQNSVAFLIGGANFGGVPTGLFTGLIDEVQIYNYSLVDSDVDFLFHNPGQEIAPHQLPPGDWRLNTIAGAGGTIARGPDLAKYSNGATVTVTAIPSSGFVFTGWSGDATGTNNPITITMTGNKTVTANFNSIPIEKVLAHWRFDETNGSVAHDSVGAFNGTLSSSGASFVSGGISGGALSLSKTNNGLVNMGNVLGLGGTDFSIVAWIRMAAGDSTDSSVILSKQAAFTRNGYALDVNKTGGLLLDNRASFIEGGSGVAQITTAETPISTTAVNDGNWHQIVVVYQLGGMKSIYVDGAPAEDSKLSQPFNQNSVAFLIGGVNFGGIPTGFFTGLIDEVQIYNYALANSNVDFLFQNPGQEIAPHDLPPGDWRLNAIAGIGGTIRRSPDLGKYTNGATVTVTAIPSSGFVFTGWSGDADGTNNPITITMAGNKTVTASFRDAAPPTVTITSPVSGTISDERFQLAGSVLDNGGVISARWEWNGQAMGSLALTNNQFLVGSLKLKPGDNRLTVFAVDGADNQGVAEVVAIWAPERILSVVSPGPRQEGQLVDVPVHLISQGDVGGMSFTLGYDTNYLRDPQLTWSSQVGSALDQVNYDTPGLVRATFALPATAVPAGTQDVAAISFRTRSVPTNLTTALTLELTDVSRPTGNSIAFGNLAVPGSAPILLRRVIGDNNANDRFDVGDASIIQRLLIGLETVRSWDVRGNDVNANSSLDSGDVIRVLRAVVGLDPQPQLQSASRASRLSKMDLGKAGPSPSDALFGLAFLSPDGLRGQPGELVTIQVRLQEMATQLEGASFTLDYPTNALRLLNAQSARTGALVPSSALTLWNVQPAQNDYAAQNGRVRVAMSSASPWPTNNGVLAEFIFQVQSGQVGQFCWPIQLSDLQLTSDGYDITHLAPAQICYVGREPIPPNLSSTSGGMSSNGFSLLLSGDSGVVYGIEASSDLANWSPLATLITGGNGTLSFVDPAATNSPQRFYRAKQQ